MIFLYAILPIIEILIFRSLNRRWEENDTFGGARIFVSVFLCLLTIAITVTLLSASDYRKSKIDVSPMAELTAEQVYLLEDTLKLLEDHRFILWFRQSEGADGKNYSFTWYNPEFVVSVRVTVDVFATEDDAKNRLQDSTGALIKRYKLIQHDNDTEALLFHARRSENIFGTSWSQSSYLRFGNALIDTHEGALYGQGVRNVTNEFVEWLCDVLIELSHMTGDGAI